MDRNNKSWFVRPVPRVDQGQGRIQKGSLGGGAHTGRGGGYSDVGSISSILLSQFFERSWGGTCPLGHPLDPRLKGAGGGGDAHHRRSVDLEGSGGMRSSRIFFINLIEYGISFCILKYKSLSLYL